MVLGMTPERWPSTLGVVFLGAASAALSGAPEQSPWATSENGERVCVSAAGLSGLYAVGDATSDRIEIRDVRQTLLGEVSREDIGALLPWMTLDDSTDGPAALAFSDSGRLLFISVFDQAPAPDGQGSDAVLRYDTNTGDLAVFARVELHNGGDAPHLCLLHTHGRLYVGTSGSGLRVYSATRNQTSGALLGASGPGGVAPVLGLAQDRALGKLYTSTDEGFYRAEIDQVPPQFTRVGDLPNVNAITHSDHFGDDSTRGVYAASHGGELLHITDLQALGVQTWAPSAVLDLGDTAHDVCATACGRLLATSDLGGSIVSESLDPRPDFESWLLDEFSEVVAFAKGLVSPDGEPDGWVVDADVNADGTRFHPATPDAAGWAVLLLLMSDHLAADPDAQTLVRSILQRYAGLATDGIAPSTSADGIYRHWIDPATGGVQPGWSPELATLSTMKIVLGAARAQAFYPADAAIQDAASTIISRVQGWDGYIQAGSDALYFQAEPAGGPVLGSASSPFHEGVIFVEQAAAYGDSGAALDRWLDRSQSPSATYVTGQPVTTTSNGVHSAAFTSLYSAIVQQPLRQSAEWDSHLSALLASNGAWTDDNAPAFMTVFSAGTTAPEWGGYNADSLSDHPGDVSSFPALMAFGATGRTAPAVGAYHAYRHGARQSLAGGASILFRRSAENPAFTPNDAALPDVALGALGLAELLEPGSLDAVVARAYVQACVADLAEPVGVLDFSDVLAFLVAFSTQGPDADLAPPIGAFDFSDVVAFLTAFSTGCP